ncbi:DNA-binding transcriptional regulator [Oricola sp.]|uniref:DNA-binding transcriptional regulator n=1 Tax=Oricola sp. TaxID=1979950 RepID=UPI0025D9F868|nr:DNA-binding transcriptional regulator [Oricola sp.]MCI5075866.1 DNA-binding transcriptional regulator [Oricola sp.]
MTDAPDSLLPDDIATEPEAETGSYAPIKSVEKTLLVLEELNRHPVRRVSDIHAATGIPMPTLVRILETLAGAGYVQKISRWAGYCLTHKVLSLSSGFHGLPEVFRPAREAADSLTRTLKWPSAICSFDVDAMVVRYSTIPASPLSHKHSTINRRLDLLTRAHGRAWLAFCEEAERMRVWDMLARSGRHAGQVDELRGAMEPILDDVRRKGFAARDRQTEPETHTLAAPIILGGVLIGTLGMTYFSRSVRSSADIAEHLLSASRQLSNST